MLSPCHELYSFLLGARSYTFSYYWNLFIFLELYLPVIVDSARHKDNQTPCCSDSTVRFPYICYGIILKLAEALLHQELKSCQVSSFYTPPFTRTNLSWNDQIVTILAFPVPARAGTAGECFVLATTPLSFAPLPGRSVAISSLPARWFPACYAFLRVLSSEPWHVWAFSCPARMRRRAFARI